MDPYQVLGLAAGESDGRTIRRAYARLLKQHRPDQDPESFRRVHDAYQVVLLRADTAGGSADQPHDPLPVVEVSRVAESPTSGPASSSSVSDSISATSVHSGRMISPWELALAAVQAAVDQPSGALRDGALAHALRWVADLAPLIPDGGATLIHLLERHVPGGYATWRSIFTDDHLLAEVRGGGSDLTLGTLRGCFEDSDWERLIRFANRWLDDARIADRDQRDTLGLNRVLVIWLALVDYPLAQRLLQQFPAHVLRVTDEELDQLMTMGHQARDLPDTARRHLCDLLRGKRSDDAESVIARGHLLAHLPRIPADSLLGRVLRQHFPGYSALGGKGGGTEIPLNLLSLTIAAFCFTVFVGGAWMMAEYSLKDRIGNIGVTLMVMGLVVLPAVLGWFTYRAAAPPYFRVVRPWLWQHLGPFDIPCRLLLLWSAFSALFLLLFLDVSGTVWLVAATLFLPVALLTIRWGRLVLAASLAGLPTWSGTGSRLREALIGEGQIGGDLTMAGFVRAVRSAWAGLPAMVAAGVLILGLANCPAWAPARFEGHVIAFLGWIVPWIIASLIIHARLLHWRQEHGSWWVPFRILAWCVWLPMAPWLATMSLVWTGHAREPAGAATGILAVVVAALLPLIVAQRLRRR